jgi:apolipoprotein N-acyltransferase
MPYVFPRRGLEPSVWIRFGFITLSLILSVGVAALSMPVLAWAAWACWSGFALAAWVLVVAVAAWE